jgi:hypothetical protein
MKKFILLSFMGLLIMAFSTSVYAMDFKASGFIDAQWFYNVNATPANPAGGIYDVLPAVFKYGSPVTYVLPFGTFTVPVKGGALDRKVNYYEARTRLKFDAIMDKNLSGTILFEMDSSRWGDIPGGSTAKISERNTYGYWSADRAAVEIKNIYIDFGLPYVGIPVPMSFRVGLQPASIRNNIFLYTDGMGVTWNTKIDPVALQLMWFKPLEGRDATSTDDVDVLGGHLTAKIGTITAGGYALYYNMNAYPFNSITAGTVYDYDGSFKAKMWWFGAYADGKLGPVNFNLDGIYDRGKVEARELINGSMSYAFVPDVKYRGWAARAKIDFPWQKFNFGVTGYYASGADTEDTSASGLPGTTPGTGLAPYTTKVRSYVIPPGSESGAIFGESVVFYSFWGNRGDSGIANTLNYNQMSRGPIGGTWMAKAYASVMATPWYKVTLQGMYIGDTTKNGDTFGNAAALGIYPYAGGLYLMSTRRDKNDIGWEIDLINEINIYKNLKLIIAGGYLFAGKAMDQYQGLWYGLIPLNDEIKNPWAITWNLTYNF